MIIAAPQTAKSPLPNNGSGDFVLNHVSAQVMLRLTEAAAVPLK